MIRLLLEPVIKIPYPWLLMELFSIIALPPKLWISMPYSTPLIALLKIDSESYSLGLPTIWIDEDASLS
jgi:hypothetical protein